MKGRTVLLLVVVLAALVGYVVVVELPKPDPDRAEAEARVLTQVGVDRTVALELRVGDRVTRISRDSEGRWFLRSPVEDRADDLQVRALLGELSPLEAIRFVAGTRAEEVTYRLDRPTVVALFSRPTGGGTTTTTLTVGRKNAALNGYYAMVDDDRSRIGLIDPHVVEAYLLRDADGYRYRRVAEFRLDDVARVGIAVEGRRVLLQRNRARDWEVVSPIRSHADQGTVNALVQRFAAQTKGAFLDDSHPDLGRYGLDDPEVEIRVELENKAQRALLIGHDTPDGTASYAMRPGATQARVFTIPRTSRDELERTLFDLRYRRFVLLRDTGVVGVTIGTGGEVLDARVSDGRWTDLVTDERLRTGAMDVIRQALVELSAEAFLDGTRPDQRGLDPPTVEVTVTLSDGSTQALALGLHEGEAYARAVPDGPVARIPRTEYDRLVRLVASPPRADGGGS